MKQIKTQMKIIILILSTLIVQFNCISQIIWSDDFSNPNNWVIEHDPSACSLDWQIGVGLQCTGSYPIDAIESTSAANGYAMVDSDAYGGATGGQEVEDSWITTNDPIDLSEQLNVFLKFETQYKKYNSEQCFLVISTTNNDWPSLYPNYNADSNPNVYRLFTDLSESDATPTNPTIVNLDISEIAGGESQVWIRFHWTGTWGYSWFVDDLALIDCNTNIFTSSIVNTCESDGSITVNSTGNFGNVTYSWSNIDGVFIGEGSTLEGFPAGTYTVSATDEIGCQVVEDFVITNFEIDIDFTSNQQLFTSPPFAVAFSNNSADLLNTNYTWFWGDGTSTSSNNATVFHEYLNNGLYTVTLQAIDNQSGCIDQLTMTDYIYATGGVSCVHNATILQTGPITGCQGQGVILSCNNDPNYNYQWRRNGTYIAGNNNDTLIVNSTGLYDVIITENNCAVSSSEIAVNFFPGVTPPSITGSGNIQSCVGGIVTLYASPGYESYLWSTGEETQVIEVSSSGDYTVTVSNESGCTLTSSAYSINASFMDPQQVCIVGVDSLSNFNRIVWEKPISDGIDYFKVYKEGNAADVYDFIGSVPYEDTAIFVDENSNTAVQAYRYKVSIVDSCGTESALGAFHKTIHLTINQGVGQSWNLIWNHYEGFSYPSYNIYRGTDPSNMYLLETIASNLNSYTDLDPAAGTSIYYQIEVVNNNGCDPLKATDYGLSRSNIATTGLVDVFDFYNNNISIYPNPTGGMISIESQKPIFNEFIIQDNQGRTIYEGLLEGEKTKLNLNDLSNGAYYLQIKNMVKKKIVVVH